MSEKEKPSQENAAKKTSPLTSTDRGDETFGRNEQNASRQTQREARRERQAEAHEALTRIIDREIRQRRISHGIATVEEITAEAQAVEAEADTESRRLRALALASR